MISTLKEWFASAYHQKHDMPPAQVAAYEDQARTQDLKVLAFFEDHPGQYFACHDIEAAQVLPPRTPHSSYIRAISNLCTDEKLIRGTKVPGLLGRDVNTYAISPWGFCDE